jgi:hypothetical protein
MWGAVWPKPVFLSHINSGVAFNGNTRKTEGRGGFLCIGTFSDTEVSHSVEYVVQYWGKFLCRLLMPFNTKVGKVQSCKKQHSCLREIKGKSFFK